MGGRDSCVGLDGPGPPRALARWQRSICTRSLDDMPEPSDLAHRCSLVIAALGFALLDSVDMVDEAEPRGDDGVDFVLRPKRSRAGGRIESRPVARRPRGRGAACQSRQGRLDRQEHR